MKLFVAGNVDRKSDFIAFIQLYPFFRNRKRLRRDIGVTFEHAHAASIRDIEFECKYVGEDVDALFIRPDWRDDPAEVVRVTKSLRERHPRRPLYLIDPWDQVNSRFFGALPYVTKFLKYQRLRNLQDYRADLAGGTVITDYLAREHGQDLYGWHVGSPIPDGYADRIATGWNVAVWRKFENMLFRPWHWRLSERRWRRKPKDIDVFCHLSYGSAGDKGSWYTDYRRTAVAAARRMEGRHRLAVSGEHPEQRTISSHRYRDELDRSRIVFSPFGWGETTWRDYEAVCCDALLLKPDIGHVATSPDIYRPGETYVPLKWDFSDLEEKVDHYLRHPAEAGRIIANARRTLEAYFRDGAFVAAIGDLLGLRAGVNAHAGAEVASPAWKPEGVPTAAVPAAALPASA